MHIRIRQAGGAVLAATVGLSSLVALQSAAQAAPPTRIFGTVIAAGGGALGGIQVTALKLGGTGQWAEADNAVTLADGTYQIGKFDSGTYRIRFDDPSGSFETEFYKDQPRVDLAQDIILKSGGGKFEHVDAELGAAAHFAGRVTDRSAAGIPDAVVTAYVRQDSDWVEYQHVTTAADGTYDLGGLPGGTYTLGFSDPVSGVTEYWNDKADLASADSISVTNDGTMSGLDASLATPEPTTTEPPKPTEPPAPTQTPTTTPTTAPAPVTAPAPAAPAAVKAVSVVKMPKIKGSATVGQRLRVTKGAWNPTSVKRKVQWLANGKKIKGATKTRLRLTSKLAGKKIKVKVTASAAGMTSAVVKTASTKKVKR
jgi:hypothetical protein